MKARILESSCPPAGREEIDSQSLGGLAVAEATAILKGADGRIRLEKQEIRVKSVASGFLRAGPLSTGLFREPTARKGSVNCGSATGEAVQGDPALVVRVRSGFAFRESVDVGGSTTRAYQW